MALTNAQAAQQFVALAAQFAGGSITQAQYAAAYQGILDQYNISNVALAQQIVGLTASLTSVLTNLQVIGIKGVVATTQALPATHANGDAYLVSSNGHGYAWIDSQAAWIDLGAFQGPQGTPGASLIRTSGQPAVTTGNNGDVAVDPGAGLIYVKLNGLWGQAGSIIGPAGSITIGAVTTGAPGSGAAVTNTGTPQAAQLAFSIPQGLQGIQGIQGIQGFAGWSPVLAIVTDSARRVLQVVDWTGGAGSKPATGQYVGASGLTATLASGVDIRGPQGAAGTGNGNVNPQGSIAAGHYATFVDSTGTLIQDGGPVITKLSQLANDAAFITAAGAPVQSVAGRTGAITLAAADISGLGSAATKTAGTAAGNVVLLDGSARLPAVDASLLINLPSTTDATLAARVTANERELVVLELLRSVSTVAAAAVFFLDDYADLSGIDTANSTNVFLTPGDVTNGAPAPATSPAVTGTPASLTATTTTVGSYTVSASTNGYSEGPGYAFDQSSPPSHWWQSGNASAGVGEWISYARTDGSKISMGKYTLVCSGNYPNNMPSGWVIEGQNSDGTFIQLDAQSGVAWTANQARTYSLAAANLVKSFVAIRMRSTTMPGGGVNSNTVILGQFTPYGVNSSPAAMSLRSIRITLKYTPSRVFAYLPIKMGGGAINTDVIGAVTRDGATYTTGVFVKLFDRPDGSSIYELQGADGKPGVDVTGQPAGQQIGYRITTTATYRHDLYAADCRGA